MSKNECLRVVSVALAIRMTQSQNREYILDTAGKVYEFIAADSPFQGSDDKAQVSIHRWVKGLDRASKSASADPERLALCCPLLELIDVIRSLFLHFDDGIYGEREKNER